MSDWHDASWRPRGSVWVVAAAATLVTYAGAPHSFFDRKQEEFGEASADAWARVLAFLERQAA